jgi:Na+/proline symporter
MTAYLGLMARSGIFLDPATIKDAKEVLPTLLMTPSFIHPVLGGVAIAAILAAILSTIGPVNFAIVTIATKDIYHSLVKKNASDENILKMARRLVLLVNVITVPMAIFIKGAVLDAGYVSYAIRAIGAIVILLGIYKLKWISQHAVRFAFIGGTFAIILSLIAKKMGWFEIDKTYASIIATVFFIIVGNLYTRFIHKKKIILQE